MAGVSDKNAFRAGLFIVVALVIAAVILWLVSGQGLSGGRTWWVAFDINDDLSDLSTGSEVRVGGVRLGEVREVEFGDEFDRVLVQVSLPDNVPLRENPTVRVQSTLTGQVWLNFTNLGDGELLQEGAVIEGTAGTISDLVQTVNRLAPTINDIAEQLRSDILPKADRVLGESEQAVASVRRAADNAGDVAEAFNEVFANGGSSDLRQTLESIRIAAEGMPKLVEDANHLATRATEAVDTVQLTVEDTGQRLERILEQVEVAAEDVTAAADDTRVTVATVRGLIAGNRGRINAIIDRLGDTARTLNLASNEIRRSPWRLLYRPSGEQRANMNLYDAARQFAEGANALQDAAIALEGASADPAAEPEEIERMLEDLRVRFEEFDAAQRELFQRIRD